jgi:hypothetical protein
MIVRLKGVKRARAKGHVYFYHRGTGTRLPDDPNSAAFMDMLATLNRKGELAVRPGTLGDLIARYRALPEFTGCAVETHATYQKTFNYLQPLAGMPLVKIDSAFLYEVRDRANTKHKRHFANYMITVLRLLFNWAIKRKLADGNPALAVDKIRRPKNAKVVNRRWRLEELDIVLDEAPFHLQAPIAIGAYGACEKGTWPA